MDLPASKKQPRTTTQNGPRRQSDVNGQRRQSNGCERTVKAKDQKERVNIKKEMMTKQYQRRQGQVKKIQGPLRDIYMHLGRRLHKLVVAF